MPQAPKEPHASTLVQGDGQRLDEVGRVLDAARDPDEAVTDADLQAVLLE
eukprot:CAMPEP_0176262108 /NCGR_PEP_ID=MMETSP0121_2-20121125/40442_1 /TAXON_ID=160619 /ORGANISM="Kryptoperidinium foliaceum, Strain CCMP 1326" /LENGTH=49 /DNA_ID= /DNA_START= /DNA_END= /DNA_ORIENTATION=